MTFRSVCPVLSLCQLVMSSTLYTPKYACACAPARPCPTLLPLSLRRDCSRGLGATVFTLPQLPSHGSHPHVPFMLCHHFACARLHDQEVSPIPTSLLRHSWCKREGPLRSCGAPALLSPALLAIAMLLLSALPVHSSDIRSCSPFRHGAIRTQRHCVSAGR